MPWYWTDEITETLVRLGRLKDAALERTSAVPIGVRRSETTLEEAALALQEDGEIPLAA